MPRDGSGGYSLPAGYFVSIGDDVLPSQHNPPLEDIAQALTNSLARTGAGAMTGTLNMGNNPISNVTSITGSAIMAAEDLRKATLGKIVTTNRIWDDAGSVDLGNLSGTVSLDFNDFLGLAHGVATGNVELGPITNGKPGQTVLFDISQDGTGGWELSYDATYWLSPNAQISWSEDPLARNILIATILHDGKAVVVSATSSEGIS